MVVWSHTDSGSAQAVGRFYAHLLNAGSHPLTENGSGYTAVKTKAFASALGLKPLTTPVCSPQSNGMAESFVKTMKRDYVAFMPKPDAIRQFAIWPLPLNTTTSSTPIAP